MRIKLQALTEHIHGFLLILGITAFLSCLIFPSHYLFYFFHSFLLLIPFAVTAYGQEKSNILSAISLLVLHVPFCCFYWNATFGRNCTFLILSVAIMQSVFLPVFKNRTTMKLMDENVIESGGLFDSPKCRLFRVFCSSLFYRLAAKTK